MKLSAILRAGSVAALAAALTLPPIAAQAQERPGNPRGAQAQRNDSRTLSPAARGVAERVERAQRATSIENRAGQRAAQIERSGDAAARQAARQGNVRQAQRIDRQSEQAARRVEQQASQRAQDVMKGREPQPGTGADNRDWNLNNPSWNGRPDDRRDPNTRNPAWQGNPGRDQANRPGNRPGQQQWDRNWRNDQRYDWNRYRQTNRRLYTPGRYSAPYRNYGYQRLSIGRPLDSQFFGSRYWINDPWQYRLPPVNGAYRWVRYYDDVLLVDTRSGRVADVIYDFFW